MGIFYKVHIFSCARHKSVISNDKYSCQRANTFVARQITDETN